MSSLFTHASASEQTEELERGVRQNESEGTGSQGWAELNKNIIIESRVCEEEEGEEKEEAVIWIDGEEWGLTVRMCVWWICVAHVSWKEGWRDWSLRRHVNDDNDDGDGEEDDDDDAVVALYPLLIPADQNNNNMLLFSGAKKKKKGMKKNENGRKKKDRLLSVLGSWREAAPLLHEFPEESAFFWLGVRD